MDDLDRLIDEAARQMAQREPSDALAGAVMERVSARGTLFAPPRVILGGVVAAAAIVAVVMLVSVNRTVPSAKAPPQAQGSGLTAQDSGSTTQDSGLKAQVIGLRAQRGLPIPDEGEIEPIDDPIIFETISPPPIEVERLEVILISVDPIKIAPIEIEPISASND